MNSSTSRSGQESPAQTIHESVAPDIDLEASKEKQQNDPEAPPVQGADPWDTDPDNPRTWASGKKWSMVAIVSMYTFVSPLASSMMAPALGEIAVGFHITNSTVIALTLSIFLLAFALGPLVLGPLSELYGRTWVLHISNLFFLAFSVGCALAPNTASLIVFRFLAGLGGSAPLAIGAGSVSDLFEPAQRAGAMGAFSMGPLIGPVVGPIAGGFIADTIGYKWIFWIISILSGTASIIGIPLLRETYAPIIRKRRALAAGEIVSDYGDLTLSSYLWVNLSRPVVLLSHSLICFMLSLYQSIIYGLLYLLFVTFPAVYSKTYGWGPGVAGLAYIGPGLGFLIATSVGSKYMNVSYAKLSARNNGVGKPEFRLPLTFVGTVFLPVGLLWYGWSADKGVHWIMPIIGSGIFGAGMMCCFLPIQVYLVDSFTYAASAVAAATLLRSLFGFAFPLFADRLFEALGTGGGCSLLAGLSVVVGGPFAVYLYYNGEAMRKRNPLNR